MILVVSIIRRFREVHLRAQWHVRMGLQASILIWVGRGLSDCERVKNFYIVMMKMTPALLNLPKAKHLHIALYITIWVERLV